MSIEQRVRMCLMIERIHEQKDYRREFKIPWEKNRRRGG